MCHVHCHRSHRFYTAREVLEQRISRTVKCNNLRYVCNGQITERHLTPRDGRILKLRMKKKMTISRTNRRYKRLTRVYENNNFFSR